MQYVERIGYKAEAGVKVKLESIAYYPFHLHKQDLEIICVLNGNVKISDSAASYALYYGDVHIFNPNDPHKILSDDPQNIILTIQIDCNHYKQYYEGLSNAYFICDTYAQRDLYALDIKHIRFQLARLYQAYSGECSSLRLEGYTKELLALLLAQFQEYVYKGDEEKAANIVRLQNMDLIYKNYARMYRIVDYVSARFREKLSLSELANMEFLSVAHLSRYLKESLGLTFTQLVSLTRCEEAARLLSATRKNIDQIAVEVGFANRKHFAVQFRRWYEKTPSEYREEILKDLSSHARVRLRPFDYQFAKMILDLYLDEY